MRILVQINSLKNGNFGWAVEFHNADFLEKKDGWKLGKLRMFELFQRRALFSQAAYYTFYQLLLNKLPIAFDNVESFWQYPPNYDKAQNQMNNLQNSLTKRKNVWHLHMLLTSNKTVGMD